MSRLLIVANRLPVTVRLDPESEALDVVRSSGGLATGLQGPHDQSEGRWIGWSGVPGPLEPALAEELEQRLGELRLVPVELTAEQVEGYYEGFSNGVLWPLFHYFLDQGPVHGADWDMYREVNERFADVVAAQCRPGDLIWVHDYQLMLVPELLRRRIPDARIGFFLHIPFPSSEVFRILPFREQILNGLLGADLIGFHTGSYLRHFAAALTHILGMSVDIDHVHCSGREVHLGVFPMGVDAAGFASMAADSGVEQEAHELRRDGVKLLLGVDRLDYTKGIPRRLLAYEQLLETCPELRERVRLVQVAVPSRTEVEAYQEFRQTVDRIIGRIHGRFATPHWVPIHYMYRNLDEPEVVALYRAADVMLVTPLRDGMNLVAKEFVASRTDGDGVLVLSEFAGAASELAEAIHVNPYDLDRTTEAFYRALTMDERERRSRMAALRRRVDSADVHRWAASFIETLEELAPTAETRAERRQAPRRRPSAELPLIKLHDAAELVLLLDYDGTLVELAPTPDLARPDPELFELLRALAERPHTTVYVVSGRKRETMDQWLGQLPIGLWAEHGFWSRSGPTAPWVPAGELHPSWRDPALAILQDVTTRTPGALIEEKSAGLAWHYRMADEEYGQQQANELRLHLNQVLSNQPVEILDGNMVIEIRPHGMNKGLVVPDVLNTHRPGAVLAAIGDDRTDEDLFRALPAEAVTVKVGPGDTAARYRLADVTAVRAFLASLLDPIPAP